MLKIHLMKFYRIKHQVGHTHKKDERNKDENRKSL